MSDHAYLSRTPEEIGAASRALHVSPHLEGLSYGERQSFLGKGRPIPVVCLQRIPPGGHVGQSFWERSAVTKRVRVRGEVMAGPICKPEGNSSGFEFAVARRHLHSLLFSNCVSRMATGCRGGLLGPWEPLLPWAFCPAPKRLASAGEGKRAVGRLRGTAQTRIPETGSGCGCLENPTEGEELGTD